MLFLKKNEACNRETVNNSLTRKILKYDMEY